MDAVESNYSQTAGHVLTLTGQDLARTGPSPTRSNAPLSRLQRRGRAEATVGGLGLNRRGARSVSDGDGAWLERDRPVGKCQRA